MVIFLLGVDPPWAPYVPLSSVRPLSHPFHLRFNRSGRGQRCKLSGWVTGSPPGLGLGTWQEKGTQGLCCGKYLLSLPYAHSLLRGGPQHSSLQMSRCSPKASLSSCTQEMRLHMPATLPFSLFPEGTMPFLAPGPPHLCQTCLSPARLVTT